MLEKLPPPVVDWIAPLWVWLLGLLGGATAYLEDFKLEDGWKVWLLKALTQGTSSGLAAVLTYHALLAMNFSGSSLIVMVGVASHMGTEALKTLGEVWKGKVGK